MEGVTTPKKKKKKKEGGGVTEDEALSPTEDVVSPKGKKKKKKTEGAEGRQYMNLKYFQLWYAFCIFSYSILYF